MSRDRTGAKRIGEALAIAIVGSYTLITKRDVRTVELRDGSVNDAPNSNGRDNDAGNQSYPRQKGIIYLSPVANNRRTRK